MSAFVSPYIPTTTATVTRAADVASVTGTNFSSWFNATEGTFVVEYSRPQNTDFGILIEVKATSTATADRINVSATSTADPRDQVYIGGVSCLETNNTFAVQSVNTSIKNAFGYKSGDSAAVRGGGTPVTSATAFAAPSYTNMQIGGTDNTNYGPVSSSYLNGYITRIVYYNKRLSDTILRGLTS